MLSHMHMEGDKLHLEGKAPNENVKNGVWNAIKAVGDSLWKIAANFYGNGSQFPKIIAGNPGKLKDEHSVIHPGDVLVIPD